MKTPLQTYVLAALLTLVAAVLAATCSWYAAKTKFNNKDISIIKERDAARNTSVFFSNEIIRLSAQINELTNLLVRTQFLLDEEKKTNEPLRKQIEKMLAQEIATRLQIEKLQEENKKLTEQINNLMSELSAQKTENETLRKKIDDISLQQQDSDKAKNKISAELNAAQTKIKELETELLKQHEEKNKLQREIDSTTKEREELKKLLEKNADPSQNQ